MRSDNPIAAAVERYHADPLYLVQIVREAQAALGWISRETQSEIAERLNIPRHPGRKRGEVLFVLLRRPRGALSGAVLRQHHRSHGGQSRAVQRLLGHFGAQARRDLRRRPRQRRSDVLHRHVRSGAGDAGQQHRHARSTGAHRRDRRAHQGARRRSARWPAEFFRIEDNIRRAGPLLGASDDARHARSTRRSRSAARALHRRDQALQPARTRRRRLPHRAQMGEPPQRPRRRYATSSATPTRASPARSRTACC